MSEKDDVIRATVLTFVRGQKMFTSVDISNYIKKDEGAWIRNREVQDWLHQNRNDPSLFGGYDTQMISVANGSVTAQLYLPQGEDPDTYADRNQRAMSPAEVAAVRTQGKQIVAPGPSTQAAPRTSLKASGTPSDPNIIMVRTISSYERLKIPADLVRRIGWKPGDSVDSTKIKTAGHLPKRLRVNADYRVSIPRSAVNWTGCALKVMLTRNNEVMFDKA